MNLYVSNDGKDDLDKNTYQAGLPPILPLS